MDKEKPETIYSIIRCLILCIAMCFIFHTCMDTPDREVPLFNIETACDK